MIVFGVPDQSTVSVRRTMFTVLLMIASRSILSFADPVKVNCTMKTDAKWLQYNGTVIVRYTYHKTLEKDNVLRGLVNQAAKLFEKQTCVRWIETNMTDPCHKIIFLKDKSTCSASLNDDEEKGSIIALSLKCYKIYIILHEMMHAVGIRHTHQRPDRNFYLRVWEGNIIPDTLHNYDIHRFTDTHGVPYDYQSIMHYSRLDFSRNSLYTMTPTDSLALFSVGKIQNSFRWSDTAMVNNHLECIDNLPTTCPLEDRPYCQNGGYVLHTCECSCPENTEGPVCEVKLDRPIYEKNIECGGLVDSDMTIYTNRVEFEEELRVPCVFEIAPKQCYKASILFFKVEMPGIKCTDNVLAIEYPGNLRTFCNRRSVPMDQEIPIPSSKAAVHFYMVRRFPGKASGFGAHVIINENKTWPRGTEMSQVDADCYHSTSGLYFEYRTPYFPSTVACFAKCSQQFYYDMNGNVLGFMRLELRHRLKPLELLVISDRNFKLWITHSSPESLTRVVQMPVSIKFKGKDNPGKGFAIEMHEGGVGVCNGTLFYVNKVGLEITNPIFKKDNLTNCYLHIRASDGNKLFLNLQNIAGDFLSTAIWDDTGKFNFIPRRYDNNDIEITAMGILLYYQPQGERKNWKLIVTLERCYFTTTGLCM